MTDWRAVMLDGDAAMSPERAQEIRRTVIATARNAVPGSVKWPWRLAIAAVTLTVLAGGAGDTGRRASSYEESPAFSPAGTERRQLRFATPGGTRIIWELNPEFTLMETLP